MNSRILHTSYVIDFLDVDLNSTEISRIIQKETEEMLIKNQFSLLQDWEVQFKALYTNTKHIYVFKKTKPYLAEKIKEIVIHIPIPSRDEIICGVENTQYIQTNYSPAFSKYANELEVNFRDFNNRQDYIIACLRKAIKFCFEDGFTVNGIKVKIKEYS